MRRMRLKIGSAIFPAFFVGFRVALGLTEVGGVPAIRRPIVKGQVYFVRDRGEEALRHAREMRSLSERREASSRGKAPDSRIAERMQRDAARFLLSVYDSLMNVRFEKLKATKLPPCPQLPCPTRAPVS